MHGKLFAKCEGECVNLPSRHLDDQPSGAHLKLTSLIVMLAFAGGLSACAKSSNFAEQTQPAAIAAANAEDSGLDELDPFDPNIQQTLKKMDAAYEQETGLKAHIPAIMRLSSGCRRESCAVYARVEKSEQKLYLYVNGNLEGVFLTSTGVDGRNTPNFDTHPDGRIYDRYTSTKFPGGDYDGMGNMPYAVFISGGFAIHGTGRGSWPKLGRKASHGCIRIHPDNALRFNRLVRQYGVANTWITVE